MFYMGMAKILIILLTICGSTFSWLDQKEIIDHVNNLNTTWKAGENARFKNKPIHEIRKMLSCVKRLPEDKRPKLPILPKRRLLGDEGVPEEFDARKTWPQCPTIAEVRDQSNCGSCWAFGAAEAISDRICIFSRGQDKPHISTDDLLSCCTSCGYGCNGGDPRAAWQYWVDKGLVTGGNYTKHDGCKPYPFPPCDHHVNGTLKPCPHDLQPTPGCEKKCQKGYDIPYAKDKHYGSAAYAVDRHPVSIQKEIMTNGPVEAAFDVYDDFTTYKSGVYHHVTGAPVGGHAVRMIGWGEEQGVPYWLVVNSWNTDWGDKGLFKIQRGNNECGIERDIVAGKPKSNRVHNFYFDKPHFKNPNIEY